MTYLIAAAILAGAVLALVVLIGTPLLIGDFVAHVLGVAR